MTEELKTIDTVDTSPFRKMVMTIGELPTSFVDSMTYYELLAWLCNYLENTVIKAVNNNAEVSEELQNKFIELKSYVDNYFDNLDVQEEINNKLDAMAEAGTLQDIIYDYLNSVALFCYDTVADLKLAENLVAGSYVRTLGYHSSTDGGGTIYKMSETGTANEKDIIACQNDLLAIMIPDRKNICPDQFGAYGDNIHDDTSVIQYVLDNYDVINFNQKTYLVKGISITSNKTIHGNHAKLQGDDTTDGLKLYNNTNTRISYVKIDNLDLYNYTTGIFAINCTHCLFTNVVVRDCSVGANFAGGCWINKFYNCEFKSCDNDGFRCGLTVTHPLLNLSVTSDIATFDFYSCEFSENDGYGVNGWMRAFNFYGGFSENNGLAAVRIVTEDDSKTSFANSFFGFDIEGVKIGYLIEGLGTLCKCAFLNIVGGQTTLAAPESGDTDIRAIMYFKATTCNAFNLYGIKYNARHVVNSNNDYYSMYFDATTATKTIQASFTGVDRNQSILRTNATYIIPVDVFTETDKTIPKTIALDYYNANTGNIDLPEGKSITLNLDGLKFLTNVKITTTDAASFRGYSFGQSITTFGQTGSTGKQNSSNNVTTLSFGSNASMVVIKNETESDVTISSITMSGLFSKM